MFGNELDGFCSISLMHTTNWWTTSSMSALWTDGNAKVQSVVIQLTAASSLGDKHRTWVIIVLPLAR